MLAEQRERDGGPSPALPSRAAVPAADAADEEPAAPLPNLDALVARIPPEVRETLDDLFRARFTTVQRVPKSALK